MRGLTKVWIAVVFLLLAAVEARSIHDLKTLVIYDTRLTNIDEYTRFFDSLKERSYELNFASVNEDSDDLYLYSENQRRYDNVIIFPLKTRQISKQISAKELIQFHADGGDLLTITSPEGVVESVRLFLGQLGIYPSPKSFNVEVFGNDGLTDSFEIPSTKVANKYVYEAKEESNLKYSGSAALLDNGEYLVEILKAPRESVCADQNKKEDDWTIGHQGHLIVGFQNLANARTAWVGSSSFFNNDNFSSNGEFIQELTKWTFREKSVIKSVGAKHAHADGTSYDYTPYKVKDEIVYEIGLSIWEDDSWLPFFADDVQVELRLVDPYYRLTVRPSRKTENAQFYSTGEFKLPDHHGVFTFLTDYKRSGLSFVVESDIKAIRHLANDEYPRSFEITNSWVYLAAISCVIVSFLLFVISFIASSKSSAADLTKKHQ